MGQVAPIAQRPSNTDPSSVALMLALQKIMEGNRATDARFELSRQNMQDSAANRAALAEENNKARLFQSQQHDKARAEAASDRQQTDLDYRTKRDADANALKQQQIDIRKNIASQHDQNLKTGVDPNLMMFPAGGPTDPGLNGQDKQYEQAGWVHVGPSVDPRTGKPVEVYARQGSVYTDPQNGQAALDNYVKNANPKNAPNPNGPNTGPQQGAQLGSQPKFVPGGNNDTTARNAINADLASNPDAMSSRGELADAIEKIAGVDPSQQLFDGNPAVSGKRMGDVMGGNRIPGAYNPTAIGPDTFMFTQDDKGNSTGPTAAGNADVTTLRTQPQTGVNGLTVRYQSSLDQVPEQYRGIVQKAAEAKGIDPNALASLLHQESGFRPDARSTVGALGIAQFMPDTARDYGVNARDPASAIPGAAKYLASSLDRYGGNLGLALASYNAGTGKTDAVLNGKGSFRPETLQYVKAITGQPIDAWINNKDGAVTVTGNTGDKLADAMTSQAGSTPAPVNQGGDPRMQQMLASAEDEDNDTGNALDQIRALYAGSLNGMA